MKHVLSILIILIYLLSISGDASCQPQNHLARVRALRPFTEDANYMSSAGFWHYLYYFGSKRWASHIANSTIKFDGIYAVRSEAYENAWTYYRFYADGTVLLTASTGTPQQIIRWFGKNTKDIQKGSYRVIGQQIIFSRSINEVGKINGSRIETYFFGIDKLVHYCDLSFIHLDIKDKWNDYFSGE